MFNRLDKLTIEKNPARSENLVMASDRGEMVAIDDVLRINPQILTYHMGMSGITNAPHIVTGEFREIANTQAGDYGTDFGAGNQHVYIFVDSITTGGDLVVTGTSVDESTGVPVADDTETLVITTDADVYYQTSKKWLEVTLVDIATGTIDTIDYDLGVIGYLDMGNRKFTISGFRAEFDSENTLADIGLRIRKVQDEGAGVFSIVTIENIGIDSTNGNGEIQDSVRTGGDDRSYTFGSTAWINDVMFVLKGGDYNTYFTNDENVLLGDNGEGIIIDLIGIPSGNISNVDHVTITLFFDFD